MGRRVDCRPNHLAGGSDCGGLGGTRSGLSEASHVIRESAHVFGQGSRKAGRVFIYRRGEFHAYSPELRYRKRVAPRPLRQYLANPVPMIGSGVMLMSSEALKGLSRCRAAAADTGGALSAAAVS